MESKKSQLSGRPESKAESKDVKLTGIRDLKVEDKKLLSAKDDDDDDDDYKVDVPDKDGSHCKSSDTTIATDVRGLSQPKYGDGELMAPVDVVAIKIYDGFKINWMNMRDGDSGVLMWQSEDWSENPLDEEFEAHIPKEILQCKTVSREVNFSSVERMDNFRLVQRVYYCGHCIEVFNFGFGFVIPGSTNTWQQVIEAAKEMYSAEDLSGNIKIETSFYDGDMLICKNLVKVFYD